MAALMTRDWFGPVPRPAHRPRKEWWGPWHQIPIVDLKELMKVHDASFSGVIEDLARHSAFLMEGNWK